MGKYLSKRVNKFSRNISLVIETGTFKGESTKKMAEAFDKVITIELDKNLYNLTSDKLKNEGYENIKFLCGDSGDIIDDLVKKINEPALFFLDAHWSGDSSVNWDDSNWKGYQTNTAHLGSKGKNPTGKEQVPLDREIKSISKIFKHKGVVYIDDIDKFSPTGKGLKNKAFIGEDYSHLDLNIFRNSFGTRIKLWKNIKFKQLIIVFDKIPESSQEEFSQKLYYYTVFKIKLFLNNIRNIKYFIRSIINK